MRLGDCDSLFPSFRTLPFYSFFEQTFLRRLSNFTMHSVFVFVGASSREVGGLVENSFILSARKIEFVNLLFCCCVSLCCSRFLFVFVLLVTIVRLTLKTRGLLFDFVKARPMFYLFCFAMFFVLHVLTTWSDSTVQCDFFVDVSCNEFQLTLVPPKKLTHDISIVIQRRLKNVFLVDKGCV